MVGNDPENDMAEAGINIRTYLTTDGGTTDYNSLSLNNEHQQEDSVNIRPDFCGPLAAVIDSVRQL